ncbi:FAD/NAD-binding domain-containing protein [Irpex rosettiformis]|uniref:FAD/NAD-binding domain-containing protein n=1 Tax=Irpex rosettiformis TaxID=378272 RepID=A0ACB8TQN7_9APHY|nr:FAD/NAD-binding domain-containing protein [Irpex rosettiformis]
MSSSSIPTNTQILVIGGGPAGSYAAAVLAREGFSVVLLEASKFPRYHIGESLLPSIRAFLQFIDAEETVGSHGFTPKPGAAVKLNQYKREGYTDFVALGPETGAWNVVRSEFDELLLQHAAKCGVDVFQETKVNDLQFSGDRPVSASWTHANDGTQGTISFDYLVDASGRNGIMSVKYLKTRCFSQSLKNVAHWGYWEGTNKYMPGTTRENAVWIEALNDESGWVWFIPLHDGSTSVGVVMDKDLAAQKKKLHDSDDHLEKVHKFYLEELKRAPGVMKLLGDARLRNNDGTASVKSTSDFSYAATSYAGDHYRIAGDAGAFIDPFFSSGVHLALTGALSAALTISASIRGTVSEEKAARWHDSKVGTAYTRFLIVVLGTYKQMRNQSVAIMSDIDEDNFDRAFDLLRPVLTGSADVSKTLTQDELEKTMDFCKHLFAPTDPDMYRSVGARIDPSLMCPSGPILTEREIGKLVEQTDEEAKHVLAEINARKPIHRMYNPRENFVSEAHYGLNAVLERGQLGLIAA